MADPPALWREILGRDPDAEDSEAILEDLAESDDADLGPDLAGACDAVVYSSLIADDPSLRLRLLERLAPLVGRARQAAPKESLVGGLGEVGCAVLLAATGEGPEPEPALADWIDVVLGAGAGLRDRDRISYALACAALGLDDAVSELLGAEPMRYEPDREYGPDAGSYARYLVAAAQAGAPAEEFGAAWTSFVAIFPTRLETGGLMMMDLLFAGYGAYERIFGYERDEILDGIHGFVREVAAP